MNILLDLPTKPVCFFESQDAPWGASAMTCASIVIELSLTKLLSGFMRSFHDMKCVKPQSSSLLQSKRKPDDPMTSCWSVYFCCEVRRNITECVTYLCLFIDASKVRLICTICNHADPQMFYLCCLRYNKQKRTNYETISKRISKRLTKQHNLIYKKYPAYL